MSLLRNRAIQEYKQRQQIEQDNEIAYREHLNMNTSNRIAKWFAVGLGIDPDVQLVDGRDFWIDNLHFRIVEPHYDGDFLEPESIRLIICAECDKDSRMEGSVQITHDSMIDLADLGQGIEAMENHPSHATDDTTNHQGSSLNMQDTLTADQQLLEAIKRVITENSCQGYHGGC